MLKNGVVAIAASVLLASIMQPVVSHAQTVKVGVIASLTGPGASWGIGAAEGVKIAADDLNAKGGIAIDGKSHKIEVIAYDDQYKASEAISAYNRLINQDGAKFVMIANSAPAMALKQTIENDDVLVLTSAYSSKVVDKDSKNLFRLLITPKDYIPLVVAWMKNNTQARRIAVIAPNDETGWDMTEVSARAFDKNGFTVVAKEVYERSQKDFQALLTKVLATNPDQIELGPSAPPTAGLIIRQARELGYTKGFSAMGGAGPREIVGVAGAQAADGMINVLFADPKNEGFQGLVAKYKAKIGQTPNELIVPYYDAMTVLAKTMSVAGSVDSPAKVKAAFEKALPMQSLQGETITFGGGKEEGVHGQILTVDYIGNIKSGEPVVVGVAK